MLLVYQIHCEDCDEDYVGELGQSLKARVDQHRWPSSTGSMVSQHINNMDPKHHVDIDSVRVLTTNKKWLMRGIKEAIYIRALRPSLNRDDGRYDLPAI